MSRTSRIAVLAGWVAVAAGCDKSGDGGDTDAGTGESTGNGVDGESGTGGANSGDDGRSDGSGTGGSGSAGESGSGSGTGGGSGNGKTDSGSDSSPSDQNHAACLEQKTQAGCEAVQLGDAGLCSWKLAARFSLSNACEVLQTDTHYCVFVEYPADICGEKVRCPDVDNPPYTLAGRSVEDDAVDYIGVCTIDEVPPGWVYCTRPDDDPLCACACDVEP